MLRNQGENFTAASCRQYLLIPWAIKIPEPNSDQLQAKKLREVDPNFES